MANLLDTIKQNRQQLQGTQAPVTDQTQQVQGLLRAKSGKQVGPSDTATSNIGEQATVSQTQQQLGQLGNQIGIQQQADEIEARKQQLQADQSRQQIEQARKFQTVENKLKTQQLLGDLERDKQSLNLDRDKARLEQTAFLLSMQDERYLNDLQETGRRRRLGNEANFKQEMAEMALGDNLALLKDKLGKQDILQASDRDYRKALSSLSIEDAIRIAEMDMAHSEQMASLQREQTRATGRSQALQAAGQAQAQGLAELIRGGLAAGQAYADGKFKSENKQDKSDKKV